MPGDDLDFGGEVAADRAALLLEAARRIDALSAHLGEPADAGADTVPGEPDAGYGELVRGLVEDVVEFGDFPDVHPVPLLELPDADRVSAAWQAARDAEFTFWWIRLPLLLFPRRGWAFTRLEVRAEFNAGEPDPTRKPKVFDILPNRRFDTIMRAGAELVVGLGADGHFSVDTGAVPGIPPGIPLGAKANAEAGIKVDVAITPVRYRMAASRVDHSAEGLSKVFWRLDGPEFFQENPPQLIIVLQVPKSAGGVELQAVLRAYRRFTLFPAGLRSMISELPDALRTFFRGGAPVQAVARYDLSSATGTGARG
ncbi:hypothetical protein [Amycolatopsis sp. NPDC004625]|uniref:hypothetical protein n=1 Tax=Amycolatopsis sp. NPDC004625 TaxID=3154670 RepID=UPI0033A3C6BF